MSKIKETIKDEVVDLAWEHRMHINEFFNNCSECAREATHLTEDKRREEAEQADWTEYEKHDD